MLVGAYAVAAHGLPRATGDIDLWIRCSDDNAGRVLKALAKFGAPLSALTKQDLVTPGIVIQLGITPRRIDILTERTDVTFSEAAPSQVVVNIEGIEVPVISLPLLLKNKRAVGRPQDLADVARLELLE